MIDLITTIITALCLFSSIFVTGKALTESIHRGANINIGWILAAVLWTITALVGGWI